MCSLDETPEGQAALRQGRTDPVGTHPGYRRLGLARVLLCSGARLLKERGADYAILGTSSTNIPMQRAAESAGYTIREVTKIWFQKVLIERDSPEP
jgi:ribosomal protein S18 acetylase RimI-like enzyme